MSDKKKQTPNEANDIENKTSTPNTSEGLSASITISKPEAEKQPQQDKTPNDPSNVTSPKSKTSVKKAAPKATEKPVTKTQSKRSKTAILALLIALMAIAASAGHYYWSMQQSNKFQQQIQQDNTTNLAKLRTELTQKLAQQEQVTSATVQAITHELTLKSQEKIIFLEQKIARLSQNKPSDWLLHEAEYLIRVAARSLWLEKDTTAAINLLRDAEQRLAELNDPQLLSIREALHSDIASLQLLPKLDTENVILKLMALDNQIKLLPLAMVEIPENIVTADIELSDDISDWSSNLAKTWDRFVKEYITVHQRTGNVEPLMSPEFQQNLRENLSLKIQTAIWAARKANSDIYIASLIEIEQWLQSYFDMNEAVNRNFLSALTQLKANIISAEYDNKLISLARIRTLIEAMNKAPINSQVETPEAESDDLVTPESEAETQAPIDNKTDTLEEA